MPTRSNGQMIKGIGAAVMLTGVALRGPTLFGLPGFLRALFGGHIPLDPLGIEAVLLVVLGLVVLAFKVSLGRGLMRLQPGAWLPVVRLTRFDLLMIAYMRVRIAFSDGVSEATGIWLVILIMVVVADIATLVLLQAPSVRDGFPESVHRAAGRHEARVAYCRKLRDGWQSVGRGPDYTIVNIGPFNFILAPLYWALAGIFYVVVVLPFRPWGGR